MWLHVHAGQAIMTVDKEIRSPADMAGMKMRIPTRTGAWVIEALGASPLATPVPEVPAALSRGVSRVAVRARRDARARTQRDAIGGEARARGAALRHRQGRAPRLEALAVGVDAVSRAVVRNESRSDSNEFPSIS